MFYDRKMLQEKFFSLNDLETVLARIALIFTFLHTVAILFISMVFPDMYERFMGNYLLRVLDPFWWILWFLFALLSIRSGMFDYERHAFLVGGSALFGTVASLIVTIIWGLAYGAMILLGAFSIVGLCLFLNYTKKHRN